MIKDKLYEYLMTYISDYFFEINKSQLQLALLSGTINLTQLKLNPNKFNTLLQSYDIPFRMKAGIIKTLQIKVYLILIYSLIYPVFFRVLLILLSMMLSSYLVRSLILPLPNVFLWYNGKRVGKK